MDRSLTLACTCIALVGSGAAASGAVIAEHLGDTNPINGSPTTWELLKSGNQVNIELDEGPPASILIDDYGTTSSAFYRYQPTAQEHADATLNGWKLSASIRVNEADDVIGDFGISLQYNTNDSRSFTLEWGSTASGEPIVGVQLGARPDWQHVVTGSDTSEFNLYELVFPAGGTTASLYINGDLVRDNIGARTQNAPRVLFGAGASTGLGSGSYQMVRFESLPEPTSLALMGIGGLAVGCRGGFRRS